MVRGFYQLGSGLFTQTQVLNTISNNIANSNTTGYKEQKTVATTFEEAMLSRVDHEYTEIGNTYYATIPAEHATLHSQGAFNPTGRALDFAIQGQGFFAVEKNGEVQYTRNGCFNIDADGMLVDGEGDHVLNRNGGYIYIGTSDFRADEYGNIFTENATVQIGLYDFADYNTIREVRDGYYTGPNPMPSDNQNIKWQVLESSNVDMAQEMINAISAQRGFQYMAQAVNMYGEVLDQSISQLGKMN